MTPSGNRCGHDRRNPRLVLDRPESLKQQPWVIKQFVERCDQLYYDRTLFPELGPRKRSERIEAMVLVLRAIGRTTDRLTLRSGQRQADGTVRGYTMVTISRWCGLLVAKRPSGRLHAQRAQRALWDLRDAGFVNLTQPIERKKSGALRGLAGIRQLRMKIFERLGLASRVRRERAALWTKARQEKRAETIAERRRLRRLFGESKRAAALAKRTTEQLAERLAPPSPGADEERARAALAELARRIASKPRQ